MTTNNFFIYGDEEINDNGLSVFVVARESTIVYASLEEEDAIDIYEQMSFIFRRTKNEKLELIEIPLNVAILEKIETEFVRNYEGPEVKQNTFLN